MKTHYLIILLLLINHSILLSQSQNNQVKDSLKLYESVHLELIDKAYKYLSMIAINYKANDNEYKGVSTDGRNWYFKIPDSVYNKALGMAFRNFSTPDTSAIRMLDLCVIQQNDTFNSPNFINFNKIRNIYVKLKFLKRDSIQSFHRDLSGVIKQTKFVNDFYAINEPDIENILSVRESVNFCWFNQNKSPNKTYKEFLLEYIQLIKQYPNSKTLISMLLDQFDGGRFISKEDIQMLFNAFSEQNKNSYLGKKISEKLSIVSTPSKFQNFYLQNSVSHNLEPIITDSSKYNMIIFSASWCSPCHKLIPLLKKIKVDLSKNLNLIYISLDDQSTIKQWENLISTENINWRCLSSSKNTEYIKNKFLAYSIPKSWLVYPNGKMQFFELRDSIAVENLYKLVKSK